MSRNRPDTKLLVVHCAATRARQDIGARTINKWHLEKGIYSERGLTGYHYIIRRSGAIDLGRDLRAIGAHALGYNDVSVGICMVGGVDRDLRPQNNFKPEQFETLEKIIKVLKRIWPLAVVIPHNLLSNRACPSFDVNEWMLKWNKESDKLRATAILAELELDQ